MSWRLPSRSYQRIVRVWAGSGRSTVIDQEKTGMFDTQSPDESSELNSVSQFRVPSKVPTVSPSKVTSMA